MFIGKTRTQVYRGEIVKYHTRKSHSHIIIGHSCNPGKENKREYNRQIRNGKNKLRELKNSQWKKLHCADLWKWC